MKWEDLKVYKPLKKEELKKSFAEMTKQIYFHLKPYGFKKKGRKFLRLSNDLVEIIDIDFRGSWSGQNEYFETNLGLVPICKEKLTEAYYPIAKTELKLLNSSIKNHYRITSEYPLLADYLGRLLIENALPYFDKFNSTKKVSKRIRDFKYKSTCGGSDIYQSHLLVLYSELKNHNTKRPLFIINQQIEFIKHLINTSSQETGKLEKELQEWLKLLEKVNSKNWDLLDGELSKCEAKERQRLKLG